MAIVEQKIVLRSTYDAQTILAATTDDIPVPLSVTEQTVVGRITDGNIAALSVAQLQTLIMSAALPENVAIILDPALSADGKYSGIVETGTCGVNPSIAFGDLIYFAVADSKWELTDASAAATAFGKIGICVQAANENAATTILLWGKVRGDTAFPALTIGAPVHISETAGDIIVAAPTTASAIVRIIGYGNTADELFFCPDNSYVELA